MTSLRDYESDLLRTLKKLEPKTSFAEALAQGKTGRTVTIDPKSLNVASEPRLAGVAIRAWSGDRWIEGAASSFEPRALDALVEELGASLGTEARRTSPPGASATTVGSRDLRPARPMQDLGPDGQIARVRDIFGWAIVVPDIKVVQAIVDWEEEERLYLNTAGSNCYQRFTRTRAGLAAIAMENGTSKLNFEDAGGMGGQEVMDQLDESRVRKAAEAARAMLHAKSPPTGEMNVILDPGTTGTFAHESFGHGTEADQFVRDRSYLKPLLGEMVGPESLTLVDDGSVPGSWGSVLFDDEGHPGQRTVMIDRGRFIGALHDRDSAAALGAKPTGNTRRSDFLSRAFVRMTNTSVEPGDWTFDELVQEAGDGVVLERWMSGMEDPAGGQMQLKVMRGHKIEGGKVTDLVGGMAISGKVLEFLRDIKGISRPEDFLLSVGMCGKGHGDYLPVGDGGTFLLSRALVGPA
jgi:TldD protein